jgi:hypothetical protein
MIGMVIGGHQITRSDTALAAPFAPVPVTAFDCTPCGWTTEWMNTNRHLGLAEALVRQHLSEIPA